MLNVLILVLSARRYPWAALMDKQRATWDTIEHPDTRTIYYVGRGANHEDNVFVSQHDEELERIGHRTVEAYEHALTLPDWQFLARPHSSTYVHKRRLVEYCETLPTENVMGGLIVPKGPHEDEWLWGGGHFIISRDVVEKLMANKDKWNHGIMEDVAVSKLARELGIPYYPIKSCSINPSAPISISHPVTTWDFLTYNGDTPGGTFSDFNEINKVQDQFFYRVKHDADRSVDLTTMDLLFKTLPP